MPIAEDSAKGKTAKCPHCNAEVPGLKFCDQCGQALPAGEDAPSAPGATRVDTGEALIAGKYEIVRQLPAGGMGVVYEAVDRTIGKHVAVKKMREELKLNAKLKKQFLEEARTVAKLHHPNIVDIYTVLSGEELGEKGTDDIYIVFEFLEGETLQALYEKGGSLPFARAKDVLLKVCSALKYAHGQKVVHRDLKPANIMLGPEGLVKVLDFGIARRAMDTVMSVTNTKDSSGTMIYMAPEQELGEFDARSDLFAAGVTFYEMLTKEVPFPGPNFLAQKERGRYKKPSELAAGLPQGVDAFIARCLQAERENRFQSAAELAGELEKLG